MRDPENIRAVEEQVQPDMMGFIFWEGSRRYVSEVPAYLPKCTKVGVFVTPTEEEVLQKAKDFRLDAIQLHGGESADFCYRIKEATRLPIFKAFSIFKIMNILMFYFNFFKITSFIVIIFHSYSCIICYIFIN